MESASLLLLGGAIIMVVGEILHIVGLATHHWITVTYTGILSVNDANMGLWEYCGDSFDCKDVEEDSALWKKVKDDVKAVRAMVILGMLCGLLGIGIAALMVVFSFLRKTVPSFTPIVSFGATIAACKHDGRVFRSENRVANVIFIIIGIIIFGAEALKTVEDMYTSGSPSIDLGYSFALCIVGAILLPVGGGAVLISKGGGAAISAVA